MRRLEDVQFISVVPRALLSLLVRRDSMRSIRLLAVATTVLVLGSACGGDDPPTGGGENEAPVAIFTAPSCTVGTACAFTADPSTDDEAVTGWGWDFNGDLTNEATTKDASFTFQAEGTVPVRLIVSDAEGLADTVVNNVIVAAAPVNNTPPTASFTLPPECVAGTPCGFHSTSLDPDGTIAPEGTTWDFGDGSADETGIDVTHTYAAAGTYTVTLSVVDDDAAPASTTQQLTVTAPASQDCTTTGTLVDCSLGITNASTVKITIISQDCELSGNKLTITLPGDSEQTAFFNLCNQPVGAEYTILNTSRTAPQVLAAASTLPIRFHQGPQGTNPPVSDPGIQVTGSYPNWTLNIDDGGAAGTPGEPDFNDVVMTVVATPQ
jgi:PKD repeat protein